MLLPHLRVKHLPTTLQSTRINPVLSTPGWLICRSSALVFALPERVNMPTFLNICSISLKFAKKRNNTTAFQNIKRIISEFGRCHPLCPEAPGKSLHCKQLKEENRAGWCSRTTDLCPTQTPEVPRSPNSTNGKRRFQHLGRTPWGARALPGGRSSGGPAAPEPDGQHQLPKRRPRNLGATSTWRLRVHNK